MSWRVVVISKRAKLELNLNYLVVRGDEVTKVFLGEISTLLVESTAVSLTVALLSELLKRKIKVIFCDEYRNPQGELLPYYGSHDCSAKIRDQVAWDSEFKRVLWQTIVKEKIYQQMSVLKANSCDAFSLLEGYIDQVEENDLTNREGHAAKVYFNALFGKSFSRQEDNPINAALNYGYSILLSAFNREIVANGYLTQLGIFHDNMFNFFNLGCDFMEPFRPMVDDLVLNLSFEAFGREEKLKIVDLLNKMVVIDEKKHFINHAIKIYTKSLFVSIEKKDLTKIKFFKNEL